MGIHPSSRHLTFDYKAYKGLSLRELFWTACVVTPAVSMVFILVGCVWRYALAFGCLGFLIGFILSITTVPKILARFKADKPQGYLAKSLLIKLQHYGLGASPYVFYKGMWNKAGNIRSSDV